MARSFLGTLVLKVASVVAEQGCLAARDVLKHHLESRAREATSAEDTEEADSPDAPDGE